MIEQSTRDFFTLIRLRTLDDNDDDIREYFQLLKSQSLNALFS